MKTFLSELSRLNVPVVRTEPYNDLWDAMIVLGGKYDGVHISIGDGYYSVVREMEDGKFKFVQGTWLLEKELREAME